MITCPKCGHENEDSAVNCTSCRINLQWALEYYDEEAQRRGSELAPLPLRAEAMNAMKECKEAMKECKEAMKEFLVGEKSWRHKRVIAAGVIVVLLYGLLVVSLGVSEASSYYADYLECGKPPDSVSLCKPVGARLGLVLVFVPLLLHYLVNWLLTGHDSLFICTGVYVFPSAFAFHIVNATFYFLTAVWFSSLFEYGKRSPRQRKRAFALMILCGFACAIPICLLSYIALSDWCQGPY